MKYVLKDIINMGRAPMPITEVCTSGLTYPAEWLMDIMCKGPAVLRQKPYERFIEVPQPRVPIMFYSSTAIISLAGLVITIGWWFFHG